MKETKQKILTSAIKLFNRHGLVNVRLQHIADEAFISIGNMAYHYKNKEAIVNAIHGSLVKKQRGLLSEMNIVPLFEVIDSHFRKTFSLQLEYGFFYIDLLEIFRSYPTIGQQYRQHMHWEISQFENMLHFNSYRGSLHQEIYPGFYQELAETLFMKQKMWMNFQLLKEASIQQEDLYVHSLWSLLRPHFTDMGMREYEQIPQASP